MINALGAYTAALNRYDLDAVERMFAPNAIYMSSGMSKAHHGRAAIMAAFRAYFADYLDQVNRDTHIKRIGAHEVQSDWELTATHAPTGKQVNRKGIQVVTFNGDGLIEVIQVMDF